MKEDFLAAKNRPDDMEDGESYCWVSRSFLISITASGTNFF